MKTACVFTAALLVTASGSWAQEQPKPDPAPAAEKAESPNEPRKVSETLPGLDDLLGIPRATPAGDGEEGAPLTPAGDRSETELKKKLTAEEMADKFKQAIEEMGQLADRLELARDTGLETQRLHAEIILKLDALVKSSKSSSSSSSSSGSSTGSQSGKTAPSQPQASKPSDGQGEAGQGDNQGESMPPGFQSPELRGKLDVARAAWGSLPARVRESLMQGSNDAFSSLYESLTEEYYRRLAEEAKP